MSSNYLPDVVELGHLIKYSIVTFLYKEGLLKNLPSREKRYIRRGKEIIFYYGLSACMYIIEQRFGSDIATESAEIAFALFADETFPKVRKAKDAQAKGKLSQKNWEHFLSIFAKFAKFSSGEISDPFGNWMRSVCKCLIVDISSDNFPLEPKIICYLNIFVGWFSLFSEFIKQHFLLPEN